LRELYLARALYRCGDYEGLGKKILKEYARDLRGHYARHAQTILKEKKLKDSRITKSNTARQVRLTVSVPRKTSIDQPVELLITLTNEGIEKVVFGRINGYRDCMIRVFDSKKQACPFTSFGEQVMGGEPGIFKKYNTIPLARSESYNWQIDLSKCFEMKPGRYTVSASIELNLHTYPFKVTVEDVEFEIEGKLTVPYLIR